jgi:Aspartyl protease
MAPRRFARKRLFLTVETLETRVVPSVTIALTPADQFGPQIQTIQAYVSSDRAALSILDTGASAITFSAQDQANFLASGDGIPIKVVGGAQAAGIGGNVTGNVSQPGTILVDGIHAVTLTFDQYGFPDYAVSFANGSAHAPGIQAFVGTPTGSPNLPTVTGTPIFNPSAANNAALINMQGYTEDLSAVLPGAVLSEPDVVFVSSGTQLSAQQGTTAPIKIPLTLLGSDNHAYPGNQVTMTPNPMDTSVSVVDNRITLSRKEFLFDTGSQVTVISPAMAQALHLNLSQPTSSIVVQGVGGSVTVHGYTLTSLSVPVSGGGTLTFTNVPVYVETVAAGIDGILGMNLFNRAAQMLYAPYGRGGASLSVTFYTDPSKDLGGGLGPLNPTPISGNPLIVPALPELPTLPPSMPTPITNPYLAGPTNPAQQSPSAALQQLIAALQSELSVPNLVDQYIAAKQVTRRIADLLPTQESAINAAARLLFGPSNGPTNSVVLTNAAQQLPAAAQPILAGNPAYIVATPGLALSIPGYYVAPPQEDDVTPAESEDSADLPGPMIAPQAPMAPDDSALPNQAARAMPAEAISAFFASSVGAGEFSLGWDEVVALERIGMLTLVMAGAWAGMSQVEQARLRRNSVALTPARG